MINFCQSTLKEQIFYYYKKNTVVNSIVDTKYHCSIKNQDLNYNLSSKISLDNL